MKHFIRPVSIGIGLVLLSTVIAESLGLYEIFPSFDKALHFSGGIVAGWISYLVVRRYLSPAPMWVQWFVVLGGTALFGVVWEFAEYTSSALDFYFAVEGYLYIGDLRDTMFDLMLDVAGGGIAALWHIKKHS